MGLSTATRACAFAFIAACALLAGVARAQDVPRAVADQRASQAPALFNWNYAAIYGTGFYNIGEETVAVARLPLAYRLRAPSDEHWGLRLVMPVSAALAHFDLNHIDLGHVSTLGLSVLPGVVAEIPLRNGLVLKPFINFGKGWEFSTGTNATIWSTGASTVYNKAVGDRWLTGVGAKLTYAGYTARGDKSVLGSLALGGDLGYRSDVQMWGRKAIFGTQVVATQYFNRLEFLLPGSATKKVSNELSVGLTVGALQPFQIMGASVDRLGLGYRQGSSGLKGVELVASFPF